MAERIRHRRRQIDRPGICQLTGASPATVDHWYRHRQHTRFPEKADTDHGRDWWWRTDITTFHADYRTRRAATFTTVDYSGDADDLVNAPKAARMLGYVNHRSLPKLLLANPDESDTLPSGRIRRRWHRQSIWDFADTRIERHSTGRPPGGTPNEPHPYADDPRLAAVIQILRAEGHTRGTTAQVARQLGIHERTARRLVAVARNQDLPIANVDA
jgi:predicted DNA-binding transcriptional regulator AlpA